MKVLVLFAGTSSIEKSIEKYNLNNDTDIEYRGLDMEAKWNHHYTCNILKWDYIKELTDWTPDYIHSSFVCCEFSQLKYTSNHIRNLELGYSLIKKTFEIFDFIKTLNKNIIITCENPRNKFARNYDKLKEINRYETSYCMYGFKYMKPTDFWCNYTLDIKKICSKKNNSENCCKFRKTHSKHQVIIGYIPTKDYQITESTYYKQLKKDGDYPRGFSPTHFRYRIPDDLCYDIIKSCINIFNSF